MSIHTEPFTVMTIKKVLQHYRVAAQPTNATLNTEACSPLVPPWQLDRVRFDCLDQQFLAVDRDRRHNGPSLLETPIAKEMGPHDACVSVVGKRERERNAKIEKPSNIFTRQR
jgi:hypothetical protein